MEATALITGNTRTPTHSTLPINASPLQVDKKNPWKQNSMLGKNTFPLKKGYKVQLVYSWIISNTNQFKIALHETETLASYFVIFLVLSQPLKELSRELSAGMQV